MADHDVVVVGAGIMGMTTAYHIKRNNPRKSVLLVDRYGGAGQGNTGRSNAMFRNTFSSTDNQVLSNSSIDYYLHVQQELKEDLGLQQIGYLWLMSDEQLSSSEPHVREMERNGIKVEHLDRRLVTERLPGLATNFESDERGAMMNLASIDGALFGPKCGRLDPDRLVRYYLREFLKLGGKVSFKTDVDALVIGPRKRLGIDGEPLVWQDSVVEGVKVTGATAETISADTVVLACGAWGNELLGPVGIDGHVKSKKRQLFSISARESPDLTGLIHTKGFNGLGLVPMVILPKSGVHFKPVDEENALWVACEDEANRAYIDVPDHDLEKYRAEPDYYERGVKPVLATYFPAFAAAKMKAMWAGLYSYNTLDYLPFVFRENNLIVVGGDSGSGIMKGDSLGRIADAVYREAGEALLFGDVPYRVSRLGFEKREAEREKWVI